MGIKRASKTDLPNDIRNWGLDIEIEKIKESIKNTALTNDQRTSLTEKLQSLMTDKAACN